MSMIKKKKKNPIIEPSGEVGMYFWFVKAYHVMLQSVSSIYGCSVVRVRIRFKLGIGMGQD